MSKPANWRDATPLELQAMHALSRCRFAPATAAKRFARSMGWQASAAKPEITDKQAALLWKYCHTFRRQIRDRAVAAEANAQRLSLLRHPLPKAKQCEPDQHAHVDVGHHAQHQQEKQSVTATSNTTQRMLFSHDVSPERSRTPTPPGARCVQDSLTVGTQF